jgi:hypothetical protein
LVCLIIDFNVHSSTYLPEFHQGLSFPGCGTIVHQSNDNLKGIPFLINASKSPQGFAPWHASLSVDSYHQKLDDNCGGSLISPKAVLTGKKIIFNKISLKNNCRNVSVTFFPFFL